MEKIAIIIPFFNAEGTLSRCLESIRNQIYREFIVYLIDDGSDDHSSEICKLFCNRDSRFNYLYQENRGVSAARNLGISNAINSEFVTFVDADDSLEKDHLLSFISKKQASKESIDLFVSGYKQSKDGVCTEFFHEDSVVSLNDFLNKCLTDKSIYGYVWNKFFRREIIEENNIRFNEQIHIAEDLLFVIEYAVCSRKIFLFSDTSYIYYVTGSSAIGSDLNKNNFLSKITILDAHREILKIIENIDKVAYITLINKMVVKSSSFYQFGKVNKLADEIVNHLKQTSKDYHKLSKLQLTDQIKYNMNLYLPKTVSIIQKIR